MLQGNDVCRFHLLKPEYIHHRIKELQRSFRLRLLMCYVDIDDVIEPLQQITRAALLNDVTLICGWSPEVRYLIDTFLLLPCSLHAMTGNPILKHVNSREFYVKL